MERSAELLLEGLDKLEDNITAKKFIQIEDCRTVAIIGDIHGDVESLNFIMGNMNADTCIFLGDYGDRGENSAEVYLTLAELSERYELYLLRGNHETPNVFPHELPVELVHKFGNDGKEIYTKIRKLWEKLPYSALIEEKYWLVHGGVPTKGGRVENTGLGWREIENPDEEMALEMMWNDPWEMEKSDFNYDRGIGMFFGKRATEILLETVGAKTVIRAHQPYKILKVEQNGLVVTLGSCIRPYRLARASYLQIDCSEEAKNGFELVSDCGVVFSI